MIDCGQRSKTNIIRFSTKFIAPSLSFQGDQAADAHAARALALYSI